MSSLEKFLLKTFAHFLIGLFVFLKCPSANEWIKKLWYIYMMEYYTAERKKELLPFTTAWMELESIMLSEMSGGERQIPYDLTYRRNLMNKITRKIEPETWEHGTD